jgi:hypothetical protein
MRKHVLVPALAAIALAAFADHPAPAHAANQTPEAGIYLMTEFTGTVTGGINNECNNWGPESPSNPSYFTYPGPSQMGAIERDPNVGPGFNNVFQISYLAMTPARGLTSWSGAYRGSFVPPPPNSAPWRGLFSQTWTFIDQSSYAVTGTLSGLPSANGNYVCDLAFQGVAVRTGK